MGKADVGAEETSVGGVGVTGVLWLSAHPSGEKGLVRIATPSWLLGKSKMIL